MAHVPYVHLDTRVPIVIQMRGIVIVRHWEVMVHLQQEFIRQLLLVYVLAVGKMTATDYVLNALQDLPVQLVPTVIRDTPDRIASLIRAQMERPIPRIGRWEVVFAVPGG